MASDKALNWIICVKILDLWGININKARRLGSYDMQQSLLGILCVLSLTVQDIYQSYTPTDRESDYPQCYTTF